jgi:hypothetical protein
MREGQGREEEWEERGGRERGQLRADLGAGGIGGEGGGGGGGSGRVGLQERLSGAARAA